MKEWLPLFPSSLPGIQSSQSQFCENLDRVTTGYSTHAYNSSRQPSTHYEAEALQNITFRTARLPSRGAAQHREGQIAKTAPSSSLALIDCGIAQLQLMGYRQAPCTEEQCDYCKDSWKDSSSSSWSYWVVPKELK